MKCSVTEIVKVSIKKNVVTNIYIYKPAKTHQLHQQQVDLHCQMDSTGVLYEDKVKILLMTDYGTATKIKIFISMGSGVRTKENSKE